MWFCCGCPGIGGQCVWGVGKDSVWGFHRSQSQCQGTQMCVPMTPAHPANSKNPVLVNRGGLGPAAPGGSLETQNLGLLQTSSVCDVTRAPVVPCSLEWERRWSRGLSLATLYRCIAGTLGACPFSTSPPPGHPI